MNDPIAHHFSGHRARNCFWRHHHQTLHRLSSMNSRHLLAISLGLLALSAATLAQDSTFTYQGRLTQSSGPVTGVYDVRVSLTDAATGTGSFNLLNQFTGLPMSNGLFTVTLDFGPQFNGSNRWLELAVRTNGASTFTVLSPRQKILATPYAQYAPQADIARVAMNTSADSVSQTALQQSSVTSEKIADGTITANDLAPSVGNSFWKLGGNSGTTPGQHFIGTTDNQALELRANNQRVLRFQSGSSYGGAPNIIGGSPANLTATNLSGATIAGGGATEVPNQIHADFATIGGGWLNTASNRSATIAGGYANAVAAESGTIGGGADNLVVGIAGTVAGGAGNRARGLGPSVGGGFGNTAEGDYATIPGGQGNRASGINSLAAGESCVAESLASVAIGYHNHATGSGATALGALSRARHNGTFVWSDGSVNGFGSSAANQFLVNASDGVGINRTNPLATLHVGGTAIVEGSATVNGNALVGSTAIVNGADRWDVNSTDGDLRIGSATHRFKIGVAQGGGGAGDVWMRAHGGTGRVFIKTPGGTTFFSNEGQNAGVSLAPGGGAWTTVSDRNAKENFTPVDTQEVLAKVASLPLSTWNYKSQDQSVRHLGPMAQDFKATFGLGESDTGITTVDADGVALAAIQALNAKLKEKESRIAELEQRLAAIEAAMRK
jgi:trimeric autotransporter adhesin